MKEQLVSYELAKLAFEKGFNYMKANIYGDNAHYHRDDPEGKPSAMNQNSVRGTYLAPTLSLLQKWLRDVYDIHIAVWIYKTGVNKFYYEIGQNTEDFQKVQSGSITNLFETYEEAQEEGLKQALNLIK